jgi:hypothetical protein
VWLLLLLTSGWLTTRRERRRNSRRRGGRQQKVDDDGGDELEEVLVVLSLGELDEEVEEVVGAPFLCSSDAGDIHGDGGEGRRGEFLSVGFFPGRRKVAAAAEEEWS